MNYPMNQLYKVVGISKQAVSQHSKRQDVFNNKVLDLMAEAEDLRKEHPGCGVEKMYNVLRPDFIGRDRFVELFMDLGFRLKRKKNYRRTTYASNIFYPNLIKGLKVNKPSCCLAIGYHLYRGRRKVLLCGIYYRCLHQKDCRLSGE